MKQASPFLKNGTFTQKKYNRMLLAGTLSWAVTFIDDCADSLLAGLFLNDTAVSAVGLVDPLSLAVSFVACLLSVGTAVVYSREIGAFRQEKAYKNVGQGLICSAAISVLLAIFMVLIREPYLLYYDASEEITAMAREYYSCEIIYALVYPIYFIICQLVVVDGDDVNSFISSFISMAVNIVASYLLCGYFGIKGLAYGSIIGTIAGFLSYCVHFLSKKNSVHVKFYFNFRDVKNVIKIGSASSMSYLYGAVLDILINRFIIAVYGDKFLPAYAVVNFIFCMDCVFCALYDAGAGFLGVAYGEKNPAGIKQTMHIAYKAVVVLSVTLVVLFEFVSPNVSDLFGITDPEVQDAAVFAARALSLSLPIMAVYSLFSCYYPLVGHTWLGHILCSVHMLIAPLVMATSLGIVFGINGMLIGFTLTSTVAVLITFLVIRIKYGKKAVPLVLDETDEEAVSYEIILSESNISALCEKVKDELTERKIAPSVVNEIQLVLEESYMTILKNNSDKKVITECDLLISDKSVRLITRDNGKIFDITDVNTAIKDLRSFVLARLMENNSERSNTTTISFNRNSYIWRLTE